MSALVKNSGAACGPSVTPISQSETIAGRRSSGVCNGDVRAGGDVAGAQDVADGEGAAAVPAEPPQRER